MDFNTYKSRMTVRGGTLGEVRKQQSDEIMDATWWGDIQSRVCYIYDYFHDGEKDKLRGLNPQNDKNKVPIDTKFIITQYGTISKGEVEYHIQFRPNQECPLDYFEDLYGRKYDSVFPVGLYIDIPDDRGVYNKWLICAKHIANQFVKYSVLPCNYSLRWIYKGEKYLMSAIVRTSNSYTSGVWRDYVFQTTNNQDTLWLPANSITDNIYYDERFIVSAPIKEPIVWSVTKIDGIDTHGIVKLTLLQDKFDQFKDYVNLETYEMYADYYESAIEPVDSPQTIVEDDKNDDVIVDVNTCTVTCSGTSAVLKVNGGYKTLTAKVYDSNNNDVTNDYNLFDWSFYIDDESINDKIYIVKQDVHNIIKVKFTGDETYIGKIIECKCLCTGVDNIEGVIKIEVSCL